MHAFPLILSVRKITNYFNTFTKSELVAARWGVPPILAKLTNLFIAIITLGTLVMILAILTAVFGAVDAVLLVVLIVICRNILKRRQRRKEIEAGTKAFFEFRRLSRTLIIYTNGYKTLLLCLCLCE